MRNAEYIRAQWAIMAADAALRVGSSAEDVRPLVKDVNFLAFLQKIDEAETLGPLMDPSLWLRAHKALDRVKEAAIRVRDHLETS